MRPNQRDMHTIHLALLLCTLCLWHVGAHSQAAHSATPTTTAATTPVAAPSQSLSLMTFNMWGAGANEGLPIDQTIAVLRAANADIIGLQESRAEGDDCIGAVCPGSGKDRSADIAAALGFHHYLQRQPSAANWFNAIISRYPITGALANDLGVVIDVHGMRVHAFNIHATDYPYQPYQLLGIEYDGAPFLSTAEQAIDAARAARGDALVLLRDAIDAAGDADLEVIFGDFNEPSHRDWTERAAASGLHPIAVAFPFVLALEQLGFIDAVRAVYPDEVSKPAFTWTPRTAPTDPNDHHDRIDYVLVRGARFSVRSVTTIGEKSPESDLVVDPWPSDHRAVRVSLDIKTP